MQNAVYSKPVMLIGIIAGTVTMGLAVVYARSTQEHTSSLPIKDAMNIIKTSSGLQYIVLTPPAKNATQPKPGQKIAAHYTGWLHDETAPDNKGMKFDSSVDRGQPLVFVVGKGQVIKGWDEALLDMKVGEKRRLIIPANLGYGSHGVGPIPANATLIFDVELIEIR